MNHLITLFVDCKPTALLLDIRDEGTTQLEHTLPPHVDVFYKFEDMDLRKYDLLLLVTPFIYNTSDTPALYYVPPVLHMGVGLAQRCPSGGYRHYPSDGCCGASQHDPSCHTYRIFH